MHKDALSENEFSLFQRKFTIAIDGPSAAGKGTIARYLASTLSCVYIDSGLLYRYYAYVQSQEKSVEGASARRCRPLPGALPGPGTEATNKQTFCDLEHKSDGGEPAGLHSEGSEVTVVALDFFSPIFMYLKTMNDAQGIIPILRSEANGNAASRLSTNPCVREFINCAIREFAKNVDLVIDGRDTTTVLFPKASVKLFVTASLEKRAVRRFLEDNKEVRAISPQELQAYMTIMKDRDIRDSSRKVAPLVQANDAIVIDTSDMTISMACDTAFSVVNGKLHRI